MTRFNEKLTEPLRYHLFLLCIATGFAGIVIIIYGLIDPLYLIITKLLYLSFGWGKEIASSTSREILGRSLKFILVGLISLISSALIYSLGSFLIKKGAVYEQPLLDHFDSRFEKPIGKDVQNHMS